MITVYCFQVYFILMSLVFITLLNVFFQAVLILYQLIICNSCTDGLFGYNVLSICDSLVLNVFDLQLSLVAHYCIVSL